MNQDIINLLITLAPSIAGILGMIYTFIMAIKKVSAIISEFKQSNELKENNKQINALLKDNAQLKKLNERLLVELTRIKPMERPDDEPKN